MVLLCINMLCQYFSVTVNVFHNTHQVRCYHFFIVEIVVESVNLTQMSKQKIIITMMENNYILKKSLFFLKKYILKHRGKRRMFLQSLYYCFISLYIIARNKEL